MAFISLAVKAVLSAPSQKQQAQHRHWVAS
jgi:hypothetical protein